MRQSSFVGAQETETHPEQLAQVVATAVAQALLQQQQQQQQERPREAAAALKVDLKDFSGRQEDWGDWRIELVAKAEALGFAEELITQRDLTQVASTP